MRLLLNVPQIRGRKVPDSRPHSEFPRSRRSSSQFLRPQISSITSVSADTIPFLRHSLGLLYCSCSSSAVTHLGATS
ncbi:hypothetical protein F5888DRAFT_1696049 [Russula emetica]|nr:hypothetical protein F5888DRAFT_1696049 [Russula emetica]